MKAVANLRNCHMSARKMRLVADLVRNKPIDEALNILDFTKKEAAQWIQKCLLSAVANWEYQLFEQHNLSEGTDEYQLVISELRVDEGTFLKRFRPAPHGRAHRIRKRSCHIHLEVDNRVLLPFEEEGFEETAVEEPEELVEETVEETAEDTIEETVENKD